MNQIAIAEARPRSVLIDMSNRYGMEPAAFEATVRATCMRPDKTGRVPSREEFAAFLLVAKEYGLNPLTKEIYAFAAKGGGIVPIVSVDGWVNLVNSSKACDGFEFVMDHDEDGKLISCTCKMYRKDRSHPVTITEYLSECIRNTEPWAMKHRMLRHKSMIQAARYAFGFAGIYDEDEGRSIADSEPRDVTPRARIPSPSEVEQPEVPTTIDEAIEMRMDEGRKPDPITSGPQPKAKSYTVPNIETEYEGFLSWAADFVSRIENADDLEPFWNNEIETVRGAIFPPDMEDLMSEYRRAEQRLA